MVVVVDLCLTSIQCPPVDTISPKTPDEGGTVGVLLTLFDWVILFLIVSF